MTGTKREQRRGVGVHYDGDLRQALLGAAVAALAEVGAEHVSLRDVARRIGVSHAAPAHHFTDKTGLLTAVATEGFELFAAHLSASSAPAAGDPAAALHAIGRAYVEFADLYPGHFGVMFQPALIDTEDPAYAAASGRAFQLLRDGVAACQQQGWRREADGTALVVALWGLVHGLAVLRRQGSLGRHYHDASPDGVAAIAATLTGSP